MRLIIAFILSHYIVCNHFEFVNAMVGESVRLARLNQFPFVASIKQINRANLESEIYHGCTATVISKKHLLTTAHDLEFIQLRRLEVLVGSVDLRSGKKYNISSLITYNQWSIQQNKTTESENNDIAILTLCDLLPDDITPAKLSPLRNEDLFGLNVVTAGWGKKMNNKISRFMQTVGLKILKKLVCKSRIEGLTGRSTLVHERYLCTARFPYAFLRSGDSGSPLLYGNKLVGIGKGTSPFPENNFNPAKVNVYVGIDYYRDFIENVIKEP